MSVVIRDPRTHHMGGIRAEETVLDHKSIPCTDLVARPDHIREAEDGIGDATSPAGARLNRDLREFGPQHPQDSVVGVGVLH